MSEVNVNGEESSDDEIKLPEDTLKILNDFRAEKVERERMEEEYTNEKSSSGKTVNFEENWQLSQFWYNDKTKSDLTKICQQIIKDDDSIALLSCPSLYQSIKNVHNKVKIFEYDNRFASFGDDFVYYDFNQAENTECLSEYENEFDIIIADPPFLSQECIEKISIIIKRLKKDNTRIMFCSGSIIESLIENYLHLQKTNYKPEHERNLGNDFALYTNFNVNLINLAK